MDAAWVGLVGVLLGASISGGVAWLIARAQRRLEIEGRAIAAALQFAGLEWRGHVDVSISLSGRVEVLPPDVYVFRGLEFARRMNADKPIDAAFLKDLNKRTRTLVSELAVVDKT